MYNGDPIITYPKPYSIYLRGTIGFSVLGLGFRGPVPSRLPWPFAQFLAVMRCFNQGQLEPEGVGLGLRV